MSKILPSGQTKSTVYYDIQTKSLNSIRIGNEAGKALKDINNIIIGKDAGYSANYLNNSILLGNSTGYNIKSGHFNIIVGNNYTNITNNYILSIGYNNYTNNNSLIIGTSNINCNLSNIILGNKNIIYNDCNFIIGNNIISSNYNIIYGNNYTINGSNNICMGNAININNNNSIIIGINSNIIGNQSIIIGNNNNNLRNVIAIGNNINFNSNSIIIGNNINDYRFSLNIDNTICKYNTSNILYLGIGYKYGNTIPVLIGFNDINIIELNRYSLYIKGGLNTDEIKFGNNNDVYISLKSNNKLHKDIIYNIPPIPKNVNNILLSSDSNGNLNWLDVTDFEILHLILTGNCVSVNIRTNTLEGEGSLINNINIENNKTDEIIEGKKKEFYNINKINENFYNFIKINNTDLLNEGIKNYYFNYNNNYKYFLESLKTITTNNINQGISNIYYSYDLYNKYINLCYSNITTDYLKEGTSNFYFSTEIDNYLLNIGLKNNTINTDYLSEGISNLYFTTDRFNNNFYSNLKNITTDNLKIGTSNLLYTSNILNNLIYTTDNINEGTSNLYLTKNKINNIISNIIKTTDNINQGTSNLYYTKSNSNIFNINTLKINEGIINKYFTSNNFNKNLLLINTDNINQGTSNLYYNDNFINDLSLDEINIGNLNLTLINNNSYNSNLEIKGTLYCSNVNNIFSNINIEPNIGPLTLIKDLYDTSNVNIYNNNCEYININYHYYNDENQDYIINDDTIPLIVTEKYVGINLQNPNYELDVNGIVNAIEYIGIGSNIKNINWSNIYNTPNEVIYNFDSSQFNVINNSINIKSIISTNNNLPKILIDNDIYNFNNIIDTNDYYFVFNLTEKNNIITFYNNIICTIFIIGGGGGGGNFYGGGGGAGSYYYSSNILFTENTTYQIFIGKGGNGGIYNNISGTNGGDTYISIYNTNSNILSVRGGGCGGGYINNLPNNGGCGGGGIGFNGNLDDRYIINGSISSNEYTNGIGFDGGYGINDNSSYLLLGGGGGGIGGNGYNANNNKSGNGGDGLIINIKNFNECYGGGGGGGYENITGNLPGYGGIAKDNNNIIYKSGGDGGNNNINKGENGITSGAGGGGGGYLGNGGNGADGCVIIKITYSNITKFVGEKDDKNNPTFTWSDNSNTGIYHEKNKIGIVINGIEQFEINNIGLIGNGYGISNILWSNIINIPEIITSNVLFNQNYITPEYVLNKNYLTSNILTNYATINNIKNTQWSNINNNIYFLNNIGIGLTNPVNKLDVSGIVRVFDINNSYGYLTLNTGGQNNNCGYISFFNANNIRCGYIGYQGIDNYIALVAENIFKGYQVLGNFIINGNLGIGITNQIEKVEIIGNQKVSGYITAGYLINNNNNYNDLTNGTSLICTNQKITSNINDKLPVIILGRQGNSNIYGSKASLNISRWENNGLNSRSKLDISLSHNNYDNCNIFTIRSDGFIGINNDIPIAPLCVGNSGILNNDGYLILTKNIVINNRQIKIGYNNNLQFIIGDYGYNNQINVGWTEQFIMNYNAPSNSLYIDSFGNLFIYNNIYGNNIIGNGSNIKNLEWSNILNIPEIFTSNISSNITKSLLIPYISSNSINNIIYNNNYITSNTINSIINPYISSNILSNIVLNQGFLTYSSIDDLIINGTTQWDTDNSNVYINYFNKGYANVGIGTSTLNPLNKFSIYGNSFFSGTITANKLYLNNNNYLPIINVNYVDLSLYFLQNSLNDYYYSFNFPNVPSYIKFLLPTYCDILVVGGGGNGGISFYSGGGGGGEVIYTKRYLMNPGTYNIVVGNTGGYSSISDSNNKLLFLALGGGTGGSITSPPTYGGSGGGGYGNGNIQNGALKNKYWSCNFIDGMIGAGYNGSISSGGAGGSALGSNIGFLSSISGVNKYYGIGGNGVYPGFVERSKIQNTGCGGDGNGGVGTYGTVIFLFNNNIDIDNIYINSNNIIPIINNNNYINNISLNNSLIPYITSNNIKNIISATQWTSNYILNNIYYNGNVGIGTSLIDNNYIFKINGNAIIKGDLAITNLSLSSATILPLIYQNNNLLNNNNNFYSFISTSSLYTINFTNTLICDILIVGGGGNGGIGIYGGGGGGGEVIFIQGYTFNSGSYNISIGNKNQASSIFNNNGYLFYAKAGGNGGSYNTLITYIRNTVGIIIGENTYIYWNDNISLIYIIPGTYSLTFNNGISRLLNYNGINDYNDNTYSVLLNNIPNVWYKFDTSLINDSSGYNNTLISFNNPSYGTSIKGSYSLYLNRNNNIYMYNTTINLNSKSFSISFWCNILTKNSYIINMGSENTMNKMLKILFTFDNKMYFSFNSVDDLFTVNSYPNDIGNWVHWVFVYNSSPKYKYIYRNGILENSRSGSLDLNTSLNFYLGSYQGTDIFFDGYIDDFRIYYNVLTADNATQLYNGALYIYNNNSTSGGSGGGGSIYQNGAIGGVIWNSNLGNGMVNNGAQGSTIFGGGGGGAISKGINNIGGTGYSSSINQSITIYGNGGAGSGLNYIPTIKIENTGSGGDGNNGQGSSGIVIIKFNNSVENINKIFITSNLFSNIGLNNNFINSNLLDNYLTPYITSNILKNSFISSPFIKKKITLLDYNITTSNIINNFTFNLTPIDTIQFNCNVTNIVSNLSGVYNLTYNSGHAILTNTINTFNDNSYPFVVDSNNNYIEPTFWFKFENQAMLKDSSINNFNLEGNAGNPIYTSTPDAPKGNSYLYLINNQCLYSFNFITLNNSFSITYWSYAINNTGFVIGWGNQQSLDNSLHIGMNNGKYYFAFYGDDLASTDYYNYDINKWVHLAFIYNKENNSRLILRNGVVIAVDNSRGVINANNVIVIGQAAYGGYLFTGGINDLRYYNIFLNQIQIQNLYTGTVFFKKSIAYEIESTDTNCIVTNYNVGIGTNNTDYKLYVGGNVDIDGDININSLYTKFNLPKIYSNLQEKTITNNYYSFTDTNIIYNIEFTSKVVCDILIVGGGGDGLSDIYGGGGGGGEIIYIKNYLIEPTKTYNIKVGTNNNYSFISENNNNLLWLADSGGKGLIKSTLDPIIDTTSIYYLFISKPPWGIYSANDYNSTTNTLLDKSGNNNNATTYGNIIKLLSDTGNGATANIISISGDTSTGITWPVGSIPNTFTICTISRYTGGSYQRIFTSTDTGQINFLHGHHGGNRGVCYYNGWLTSLDSKGNLNDWLIFCGKNNANTPNNILIDGLPRGAFNGGTGNSSARLSINANEPSNWSMSYVIIWNTTLTDVEMASVSTMLRTYLNDGILISTKINQLYTYPTNEIIQNPTKGGSGGGGYLNSIGQKKGISWNSNIGFGIANDGGTGTTSYGGGGGGAISKGYNNIGGEGLITNITGTEETYGMGGNGSTIGYNPITKRLNSGNGGDGNGGKGGSGVIIFKFYRNTDINNIYISSNSLNNLNISYNYINKNALNNTLIPYITSNEINTININNNYVNSNILLNILKDNYISSNNLFNISCNIGIEFTYNRQIAIKNLSNEIINYNYISSNTLNSLTLNNNFINNNILNNILTNNYINCNLFINIATNSGFDTKINRINAINDFNSILLTCNYISSNVLNPLVLNSSFITSNVINNLLSGYINYNSIYSVDNNNIISNKNILFNNNIIKFNTTTFNIPITNNSTASTGNRILLYNNSSLINDYPISFGVDSDFNLWYSTPIDKLHKWYISGINVFNIYKNGILEIVNSNSNLPTNSIGTNNIGSRIILQSTTIATDVPYSIGISTNILWYSTPTLSSHYWYSGLNNTLKLYNTGILEFPYNSTLNTLSPPIKSNNGGTGTRLLLYGNIENETPYCIGINTNELWYCTPSTGNYKWYSGINNTVILYNTGIIEFKLLTNNVPAIPNTISNNFSTGTRIVLNNPNNTFTDTSLSIGIETNALWYCVPSTFYHKWYSGINNTLILYNTGIIEFKSLTNNIPALPTKNTISTSVSTGTRIILYSTATDNCSIGIGNSIVWNYAPDLYTYQWYTGTSNSIFNLYSKGLIEFTNTTIGIPRIGIGSFSSDGTKIILMNKDTDIPYSIGVNTNTLWYSVPTSGYHSWYSGTTNTLNIYNSGLIEIFNLTNKGIPTNGIGSGTNIGTKIILMNSLITDTPYSLGVSDNSIWYCSPSTKYHQWYIGLNNVLNLYNTGLIENPTTNIADPNITSIGTKIILLKKINDVPYSFGVNSSGIWYSAPVGFNHQWYAGINNTLTLSDRGFISFKTISISSVIINIPELPIKGIDNNTSKGTRIILHSTATDTCSIGVAPNMVWNYAPLNYNYSWYINNVNIVNIYEQPLIELSAIGTFNNPLIGLGKISGVGTRIILQNTTATNTPYSIGINSTSLWYCSPSNINHQWYSFTNNIMTLYSGGLLELNSNNTLSNIPVSTGITSNTGARIILLNKVNDVPYSIGINSTSLWYAVPSLINHQWYTGTINTLTLYNNCLLEIQSTSKSIPTELSATYTTTNGTKITLMKNETSYPYSIGIGTVGIGTFIWTGLWNSVPATNNFQWWIGGVNRFNIYESSIELISPLTLKLGVPLQGSSFSTMSLGTRIIISYDPLGGYPYSIGMDSDKSLWYTIPTAGIYKWYIGSNIKQTIYSSGLLELNNISTFNDPIAGIGSATSTGTRIIIQNSTLATDVSYSIGINSTSLWYSVPISKNYQWFTGTTNILTLYSNNLLEFQNNNISTPAINTSISTTGTKIILMKNGTSYPYAIGIGTIGISASPYKGIWNSVPIDNNFQWWINGNNTFNIYQNSIEILTSIITFIGEPNSGNTFKNMSLGTRILLNYDTNNGIPYSIGINTDILWNSVPSTGNYKWYIGSSVKQTIYSTGLLELNNTGTGTAPLSGTGTNSGTGTRIIIQNLVGDVPYAMGIGINSLWYSVPTGNGFQFYINTTNILNINSDVIEYKFGGLNKLKMWPRGIEFFDTGLGVPIYPTVQTYSFNSTSLGTKIILKWGSSSLDVPFSIGVTSSSLWNAVPWLAGNFDWYAGTNKIMNLTSSSLMTNGSITGNQALSDKRLKENIKPLENSLEIVKKLNPVEFKWKNHNDVPDKMRNNEDFGFIAQEIEEIVPLAVCDYFNYKGVQKEKLIPYLVKSIQILEKRIIELENKLM